MKKVKICALTVLALALSATLLMAAKHDMNTGFSSAHNDLKEVWYEVKKGDNLFRIAVNHGTSVHIIKFYNKNARGKYIYPGQKFRIIIPIKVYQDSVELNEKTANSENIGKEKILVKRANPELKSKGESVETKKNSVKPGVKISEKQSNDTPPAPKGNDSEYYVIKSGDYLGKISGKTKVSIADLCLWNNLEKNSIIIAGQKLKIKKPRFYEVVSGDSLYRISEKTGVPIAMLKYYNRDIPKIIHPGDILFLDKDVFIPHPLKSQERRLGKQLVRRYAQYIDLAHRQTGVDRNLIAAVMKVESYFGSNVSSTAGAYGLMQLMPEAAADMGVNRYDELQNVIGGAKYLAWLTEMFDGDLEKILAGYNAGPNAVKQYKGIPPYNETRNYITKVKKAYRKSMLEKLRT